MYETYTSDGGSAKKKKHNLPMWGGLNSRKIFLSVFLKEKLTNALRFDVQFTKK
jgi:hypothetical protein